jgi:hypothetical protein
MKNRLFNQMVIISRLTMICLCGCSGGTHRIDYSNVDLAQVSGRVTLDGQPLPYAQVMFHDTKLETITFGLTDTNGKYQLMFNSEKAGAEPGEKIVRIWTARGGLEFKDKIPKENLGRDKEKVPAAYNRSSELLVTILSTKEKSRQAFDFDLDSNKIAEKQQGNSKKPSRFDEFAPE